MTALLIFIFILECCAIIYWASRGKTRVIQFPALATAVFAGWILPQFLGLRHNENIPTGALDKALITSILCLAGCFLGYQLNSKPAHIISWRYSRKRLLLSGAALSLAGAFFFHKVNQLAPEVTMAHGGAWTGIITIFIFFASTLSFGFAITLILHLNRPSIATWTILSFGLLFYLDRIIIAGRRAAMVELFLITAYALYFNKRVVPPRIVLIAVFAIGALLVNSIGDYRSTMINYDDLSWSGAGLEAIMSIDYLGNLRDIASGEAGGSEVLNATMGIEAIDRFGSHDYGLTLWNNFVHRFIPGQLLGQDFKTSLIFNVGEPSFSSLGHTQHTGSTLTGLYDAYSSFWYLGSIKFFIIGFIFSRWYRAANNGAIAAQLIVMLTVTPALHSITHSTHHYFLYFIDLIVFLFPALFFSRIREHRSTPSLIN